MLDLNRIGSAVDSRDYTEQDFENALDVANGDEPESQVEEAKPPVQRELSGFWNPEDDEEAAPAEPHEDEPELADNEGGADEVLSAEYTDESEIAPHRSVSGLAGLNLDKPNVPKEVIVPSAPPPAVNGYQPTPQRRTVDTGLAPQHVKFSSGVVLRDVVGLPNVGDYRVLVTAGEAPRWYYIKRVQQVEDTDEYSVYAGDYIDSYPGDSPVI